MKAYALSIRREMFCQRRCFVYKRTLTLNLLTTTIVAPPSNASKWQMGFNSAFKGLILSSLPGRCPTTDGGDAGKNWRNGTAYCQRFEGL